MAKAATAKATENARAGSPKAKPAGKGPVKLAAAPRASVTVTDNQTGESFELPLMDGTVGPRVIDVRRLYTDHGLFTYDPGFTSTAACESKITYIDGEAGVLLHRGYPIQELAEHSDFLEVCYLLLHGELPSSAE